MVVKQHDSKEVWSRNDKVAKWERETRVRIYLTENADKDKGAASDETAP